MFIFNLGIQLLATVELNKLDLKLVSFAIIQRFFYVSTVSYYYELSDNIMYTLSSIRKRDSRFLPFSNLSGIIL